MRDAAFALVWMVLIPACLLSAHVGVALWIWVALLSPNEMLYGFMSGVPYNKVVTLLTLGALFTDKQRQFYIDTTTSILIVFAVCATISWAGEIQSTALSSDLYEKLLKVLVLCIAITTVMTTRARLQLAAMSVAVSIGFLGAKEGLIFLLTTGGHKVLGSGAMGDNNGAAAALLMAIPLLFFLYRNSELLYVRIGFAAMAVLNAVAVIATFSRGGFIGLVVLGLFTLKSSRNKSLTIFLMCLAGAAIYLAAPASWFARLDTLNDATNDGSFMGRVNAWKISWLIAMDHPWFGGGFHAVQNATTWFHYAPSLYVLDFIPTPPLDGLPHAAHSIWFEILGDLGFIGLAAFVAILASAYWNCRAVRRMARNEPSLKWAADLATMLQMSIAVYIVTASALSLGYFELIYVLIAMTSRTRRTAQRSLAAIANEAPAAISVRQAHRWNEAARAGIVPERAAPVPGRLG